MRNALRFEVEVSSSVNLIKDVVIANDSVFFSVLIIVLLVDLIESEQMFVSKIISELMEEEREHV